ncbi:MAG: HD domain-containing protein [Desulfitobacterium hafniense]|nr:HD domain-containing protein [Desulfitobacterium hafniense]
MFDKILYNQLASLEYIKTVLPLELLDRFTNDRYLLGHSINVLNFSYMLGLELGMPEKRLMQVSLGALMHDIGKLECCDSILMASVLTEVQRKAIQRHPTVGARMLSEIPMFEEITSCIIFHHERYNGGGYPSGVRAEDLPVEVRIVTIADSFDAMISKRPFRSSIPRSLVNAQNELVKCSGTQFDPDMVKIFNKIISNNTIEIILGLSEAVNCVDHYIAKSCSL